MSTLLEPTTTDVGDGLLEVEETPASTPARASAWIAVLALVVAVVLAPPGGDAFASGELGRVVAGLVEVRRGATWAVVPVGDPVLEGTTIRTLDEPAELDVRGGRLSLERWSELSIAEERLGLTRGELLFEADRSYAVAVGALHGSGRGTWRVAATGTVRYAVYEGGAALEEPGAEERTLIPPLREVTASEGARGDVQPLTYLASDPWDARLLAEAIRIDRLLASTERGLVARYGTALQEPAFYGDFARFTELLDHLPSLAVVSEDGRFGPPAETLVALIVAELLVAEGRSTPAEVADRIDELRAAGAEWGLIVVEQGLTADDLDRSVERAVRRRGEAVAEGTGAPVAGPPTAPGEVAPPADPDDTEPTPPPGGGEPGPEPPPPPPGGGTPPPPEDEPRPTDPVTDAVDDLGSLLEEVVPGASDVTDEVNEVIEDVGDLLP